MRIIATSNNDAQTWSRWNTGHPITQQYFPAEAWKLLQLFAEWESLGKGERSCYLEINGFTISGTYSPKEHCSVVYIDTPAI